VAEETVHIQYTRCTYTISRVFRVTRHSCQEVQLCRVTLNTVHSTDNEVGYIEKWTIFYRLPGIYHHQPTGVYIYKFGYN